MTTHDATRDATRAAARLLAALAGGDYGAWHAGDRLVLADALEDLGRDGDAAWVRGLGELQPVIDLWHDAGGVSSIRLDAHESVVFSLWVGDYRIYSEVPVFGCEGGARYELPRLPHGYSRCRGTVTASCDRFARVVVVVDLGGAKIVTILDRDTAAQQRRDLVLSRLAAPATPAPFPAPV